MRRIAFLRGINLGRRRTTNEAMLEALASAGVAEVQAYQASGNLVIDHDLDDVELASIVGATIAEVVGGPVDTFVRRCDEVDGLAAAEPFGARRLAAADGKPQVVFLHRPVDASAIPALGALSTAHDELVAVGRELFWLPDRGVSGTELDMAALERVVGLTTVRTHGTVQRLAAKFCDL
ncbi:MAG: DUF1697 domain-containing protein [Actinomycetota bacterium]